MDVLCLIFEERFVLELPTSHAMLATARPSCYLYYRDVKDVDIEVFDVCVLNFKLSRLGVKYSIQHRVLGTALRQ